MLARRAIRPVASLTITVVAILLSLPSFSQEGMHPKGRDLRVHENDDRRDVEGRQDDRRVTRAEEIGRNRDLAEQKNETFTDTKTLKQQLEEQRKAEERKPTEANASRESPSLTAVELRGKSREELVDLAKDKGFVEKNPNKYVDPVTGRERLLIHDGHVDEKTGKPFENPNAARDHAHGFDEKGNRIVDDQTGDRHFPTNDGGNK